MKILIVKTSSYGDIVQTMPLLHYLKARFPESQIDWVVEKRCASLLLDAPLIHEVIEIDSKKWQFKALGKKTYDLVFDVQGNCKSALVLLLTKAKLKIGFGKKSVAEWPNLFFTNKRYNLPTGQNIRDDYLSLAKQHFNDDSQAEVPAIESKPLKTIMVCPGSMWANKQLPLATLQQFLSLIDQKFKPFFYFIWGTEKEREFVYNLKVNASYVVEKLPLPALKSLMEEMDLVISMDSLPLHLAAITKTPTFSIFGPSSKQKYAPKGEGHFAIQGTCPYNTVFEKRCPNLRKCPTGACMTALKGHEIYSEFIAHMAHTQHSKAIGIRISN